MSAQLAEFIRSAPPGVIGASPEGSGVRYIMIQETVEVLDKSNDRLESMSVSLQGPRHGLGISQVSTDIPEEVVSVPEVER